MINNLFKLVSKQKKADIICYILMILVRRKHQKIRKIDEDC